MFLWCCFFFYMIDELYFIFFFFFQAEDGIRDLYVTGVQTCALPICFGRAFRKQIPVGNRVRAVRLWVNANDLAAQIVRVRGRLLRVPRAAAGAFVERGVLGRERIGVVAGGQVEIAARVERDRAAGVAARASLRG